MFSTCEACGGEATEHPQVHLESETVQTCVDTGLADLLSLLWANEIYTVSSCENHLWSGRCMLEFDEAADAERFLATTLAHAPHDLRLRALEATDPPDAEAGEWGFQVSLRWLAEPGQVPLLRFCPIVTYPQSDLDLVVRAFADSIGTAQQEANPVDLIVAASRGAVRAYYQLKGMEDETVERAVYETDWSRLLLSASELRVLTNKPENVAAISWLVALCAATAANRSLPVWDLATLEQYIAPLQDLMAWLEITSEHWDEILPPDAGSNEPLYRAVEFEGDPRPLDHLSDAGHEVLRAMDARDVAWTLNALEELRFHALSHWDTLAHLVNSGWYPKGDPRSRHQKELERQRLEVELTTDPRELLRERALAATWPMVVELLPLADGQLRLSAKGTGEVRKVHYTGNQRELVERARELLDLPFNAAVACRVLRDGPSRPLEVGFLPIDSRWEEVEARSVQRGDIVDRSVEYPAVVSDIHDGDHPDEVQFELNGMGWWTLNRSERLRRLLPTDLSSTG